MLKRVKGLFGKGQDQGFTLIEMLIVILIVGILAAVAAPLYLGYVRDARTAEGKSVAGALWTSVQANGVAACGQTVNVTNAYGRAGMSSSGATTDGRWITGSPGSLKVDCSSGDLGVSGTVFTIAGQKDDNTGISVRLNYDTSKSPAALRTALCSSVTPRYWMGSS